MIGPEASPGETKMWAVVRENGDFFGTCGSNNWETVEDRRVHAARGLASTELSFHLCNVLLDCPSGVPTAAETTRSSAIADKPRGWFVKLLRYGRTFCQNT